MNRILISCKEIPSPAWLNEVEPFMERVLNKIIKKARGDVLKEDGAPRNNTDATKDRGGNTLLDTNDGDNVNLELSILFCDDKFIQDLNKKYRDVDSPTDVLSFEDGDSYEDDGLQFLVLGDIVISVPQIISNAKTFSTDEVTERKRLLVHGLLHLLGLDHGDEHIDIDSAPQCEMLKLQEELLGDE